LNTHLQQNIEGTVGGAIGTVLGSVLGFISLHGLGETALFAIVGAVIGFYTNKSLKWLHKRFEK
jgi:uncharacterized protein YcfJ